MKNRRVLTTIAVAVMLLLTATACAEKLAPPAASVQALLELRAENSTDAKAYAPYFEESSVATALAEDAKTRKDAASPIPEWHTPVVKSSTDTSAVVVITWELSDDFKEWPTSTSFMLKKAGGRWVVVDAVENASKEATKTP